MEYIVQIMEALPYREVKTEKEDGTKGLFKTRGIVMKYGKSTFYGEMTGSLAEVNKDTEYQKGVVYVVQGYWKHRTYNTQKGDTGHSNDFYISSLELL